MAKRTEKTIIAFTGKMNAGKSTMLNLLSGQKDFAIVDKTAGTTADTVVTQMEIHDLGPFQVLDTAGADEVSELGNKKREKIINAVEEADLTIIVIDILQAIKTKDSLEIELQLIFQALKNQKQVLVLYNIFDQEISLELLEKYKIKLDEILEEKSLLIKANNQLEQRKLVEFIKANFTKETRDIDLLPSVKKEGFVLLVIPMDEETPTLRLLRPQDMAMERCLRKFAMPVLFRMDLSKVRKGDLEEINRYTKLLNYLKSSEEGLQLVITDSQAIDVVADLTPSDFALTTFSVMMTHYMSYGNLDLVMQGVKAVDDLKIGDKVLIVEACNHDRKCDDIATVQIPKKLEQKIGGKLDLQFCFGRVFPKNLKDVKLVIHCGACMIERQKYASRIKKIEALNIPFTNYGILLSYLKNEVVLGRVSAVFL